MRTGTVIKASRKQKFFDVVWDGSDEAVRLNVVDHLIPNEHSVGKSDMLDGRGLAHGDRVVEVPDPSGWKVRATGENWPCEPSDEPPPRPPNQSTRRLPAVGGREAIDLAFGFNGNAAPFGDEDIDHVLYGREGK